MAFQHGLSGLNVATSNLDVIGNNIANANTVGFKQSQAQFSDVYANSLSGAGGTQIGIGSKISDIAQQFTQGNISATNNPLDIAINGGGFFRMSDNGAINYSRNGQFHVDSNGFIVNAENINLTGFGTDASGTIIAAAPTNLRIPTADLSPQSTTTFAAGFNLDSRTAVPGVPPVFDPLDPTTYTSTTSGTIFDSLGNSHVFSLYFQKTAANAWDSYATVDGATNVTLGGAASQALTFNTSGVLIAPAAPFAVSVDLATIDPTLGATSPLDFTLDFAQSTQFGTNFGVNTLSQDGFSSGRIAGFAVSADGIVSGNFTNGESRTLAQVVLANFSNPQGLSSLGNNLWAETSISGQPLVGTPQTGTLGTLQSSSVEDSNVDLTTELVNMITAQRTYQANAKTIETQDAILQTLVNL
jgi:flagellar hook protein FlgE